MLAVQENDGFPVAGLKPVPGRPPFFPNVSHAAGRVVFSHLLLGHKKYPRLARGIFYRIMRDAGRQNVEEAFDMIQHVNRTQFYKLEAASEDAPPALGRLRTPGSLASLGASARRPAPP